MQKNRSRRVNAIFVSSGNNAAIYEDNSYEREELSKEIAEFKLYIKQKAEKFQINRTNRGGGDFSFITTGGPSRLHSPKNSLKKSSLANEILKSTK